MLRSWTLKRTNNVLLVLIILVNLYVILAPFYPAVVFWYEKHHTARQQQLSQMINPAHPAHVTTDTLVVPAMELNTPILEGSLSNEYSVLQQGVWRWPLGSTPDRGGNTILIGHRFTYTQPRGIFYELPQVKTDNSIGIFWKTKEYLYKVSSVSTVAPSDTAVLNQTKQPEITLYTCTPLWNPSERLIVVAKLTSTGV